MGIPLLPLYETILSHPLSFTSQKGARMDFHYEQAVEMLSRAPSTLAALLRGLPESWTTSTEGPDTWSAYDVVGHLLYADETNWMERARMIREQGGQRPFGPFNRAAMFERSQ